MRIVICGDTHIGAIFGLGAYTKNGGNTRIDDYEKTLNYIVDYAIENNVDAFIQTGDAFDSRTPAPEHMNVLNRAIKKLSRANITSIVIMGNHDYRRTGESFTSAISSLACKDYPNVRLILEPEVLKFYDKNNGNTQIVLIPYRDRRMYSGKTTEEDSNLYQQEVFSLLKECDEESPTVVIGHNFYYNGSYNDYGGTEILAKLDTFEKCDMVVMGHYHEFKIVKKKPPAVYIGSMEKINFGDEHVDKFFIDYDAATKQTKVLKCPSRQLQDESIDLSECSYLDLDLKLKNKIKDLELKDKITRLKIAIKDNLAASIKKSEVERLLYDQGAFFVSKVIIEPIITRIIRDDAILQHKDDYSMFKAFLESQENMDSDDVVVILSEAKKIIDGG